MVLITRDRVAVSSRPALTLFVLCLAVLVAQIDTAVVNLATRSIGLSFGAGVSALQWVIDGYNLVYAVLLLSGGLVADLYGRRRVFMAGAAVFTVSSLLCVFAPWVWVLIAGRALAGAGAALMIPASLAILRVAWLDPAERGRALGVWAACNGLSMIVGPTLGGVLIEYAGWRGVFFVVVPIVLVALVLAVPALPESSDPEGRHADAAGQGLGALALAGVVLAFIELRSPLLVALALAIAVPSFILFLRVERRRGKGALVPLDLFVLRPFTGAIIATAGMTFGMYGVLFLLPLAWQSTGRFDALGAGLGLLPMAVAFVVVSPLSHRFERSAGRRAATAGGVAVIGLGVIVIALGGGAPWPAEVGLLLTGIGNGVATGPLMGTAVGVVEAARAGGASALINVARMTGATAGVAILGTIYATMGGGECGLLVALSVAGTVQVAAAVTAWRRMS